MMNKCVIGLDFGTLSCRGVAIDVKNGTELWMAEVKHSHGVIRDKLLGS